MQYNFILRLIFSFTIFFGISKVNNISSQHAANVPVQATLPDNGTNKQQDNISLWQLVAILTDGNTHGHHEHGEEKFHCLYFDRLRRRASGFSIRCACVRLLLATVYAVILFSILCQFVKTLNPEGLCH